MVELHTYGISIGSTETTRSYSNFNDELRWLLNSVYYGNWWWNSHAYIYEDKTANNKKVQVGNDQETAHSEKDSYPKNRGGKKLN